MGTYTDLDNVTFDELFAENYEALGFEAPETKPEQSLYESLEGADPFAEELANFSLNPSIPKPEQEIPELPYINFHTQEAKPLGFFQKVGLTTVACITSFMPMLSSCSSTVRANKINVQNTSSVSLLDAVLHKVLPPTKTFDAINFERDAETLTSLLKQGDCESHIYQQTENLLDNVLGKKFDIIPVVLKSGRVIESQNELRCTLSDAISNADFALQKDISEALTSQYQVRDHLYECIQHLKGKRCDNDKIARFEKALSEKLENTVDGFAPTIARGLNGTLFGPTNNKREVIMLRNPDFTYEKDYNPNNPSEHLQEKLYYHLANEHGYYKGPRGGYSLVKDPTIDSILNKLDQLDTNFHSLKNAGLGHQVSEEIVLALPTHGTQDKSSGEHLFELNDGLWPISNLYEHANILLNNHPEIKSFKILALNCRSYANYDLSEKSTKADPRIETIYFNQSGLVTYSNDYEQGKVHQGSLAIFMEHLLNPPTDNNLIPTDQENLQRYTDLDYYFSGQGDKEYNQVVESKIIEKVQNSESTITRPNKDKETERLFDDEMTELIESLKL